MKIDLIILSYGQFNSTTYLCVNSIISQKEIIKKFDIFIYDNASIDETSKLLQEFADVNKDLNVVFNEKNLGYGGGMNLAVKNSAADWVVLINSDIVFAPSALNFLLGSISNAPQNIALIHPITNNAGNAQGLYAAAQDPEALFAEWNELQKFPLNVLVPQRRSDFSCVAVRRNVWQRLDGLDTIYGRGYYEDFDFSVRAKALGFDSAICENSIVFHAGSASFSKDKEQKKLIRSNKKIFKQRHPKVPLRHQRVENYGTLLHYLDCLSRPQDASQLDAYRVRLILRINTARHTLPRSFFKRLYWRFKINAVITRASVYFPEIKSLWQH